ncbi:MAG: DUF1249 domain-containing protein [Kangiellaceae bacterium]|jgi:uncharacterized protein YqiB (DUF1249 family)|nr:DUF1249 domain-containing protein [Kangiellaceae bacterium]
MAVVKRKYIPDLSQHMARCESNYVYMKKLLDMAEHNSSQQAHSLLDCSEQQSNRIFRPVLLTDLEVEKYTTTLNMRLPLVDQEWVEPIRFKVRMYHDATMAEVLEHNRNHTPKHGHNYPEQVERYADDKFQRNQLLYQCLRSFFTENYKRIAKPVLLERTKAELKALEQGSIEQRQNKIMDDLK